MWCHDNYGPVLHREHRAADAVTPSQHTPTSQAHSSTLLYRAAWSRRGASKISFFSVFLVRSQGHLGLRKPMKPNRTKFNSFQNGNACSSYEMPVCVQYCCPLPCTFNLHLSISAARPVPVQTCKGWVKICRHLLQGQGRRKVARQTQRRSKIWRVLAHSRRSAIPAPAPERRTGGYHTTYILDPHYVA